MTRQIFLLFFLLINVAAFSQETLESIKQSDLRELHDFSYEKKWIYFKLDDTIIVTILDHLPAPADCGKLATASMTIVKTEKGDTIRIIDMCNISNKYQNGQTMKVSPADKPSFVLTTPFTLSENPKTKKFEPSIYDLIVLKTTWGDLID